jgi:hypothetical protein
MSMTPPVHDAEGVIKFSAAHEDRALPRHRFAKTCAQLSAWREVLFHLGLIGQDPARYDGAGYGNVSVRTGPFPGERGRRAFVISGTQTGGAPCVSLQSYCVVTAYDARMNRVDSWGPILPSSESMTHGALYDLGPHIRAVLHVHAPHLFARARELGVPTSRDGVRYGTPDMAREVARLYRETPLEVRGVLAMGGHEDGIIAFGRDLDDAGAKLLSLAARAGEARFLEDGELCAV